MRAAVDHLAAQVLRRERLVLRRVEDDCRIQPLGEHIGNVIVIRFGTAEGEMIVFRNVAAVYMLRVIIKLHAVEQFHKVGVAIYLHGFPPDIARQVETERGEQVEPSGATDTRIHILHEPLQELRSCFEELLRLADTGFLRAGKLAVPARIQAGLGAPFRRRRTGLVAANVVGCEVQTKAHIAQVEPLFKLGVAFGK